MSEFELKKNTENELKCLLIKVINQLSSFKQFLSQKLVTANYIKIRNYGNIAQLPKFIAGKNTTTW